MALASPTVALKPALGHLHCPVDAPDLAAVAAHGQPLPHLEALLQLGTHYSSRDVLTSAVRYYSSLLVRSLPARFVLCTSSHALTPIPLCFSHAVPACTLSLHRGDQ